MFRAHTFSKVKAYEDGKEYGLLHMPQLDQKDTSNTLNLSYCFIIKILELTDRP